MCTFPVISSVASAIMSFNIMINAVYGFKFNELGHRQLQSMHIPAFNDTPNWFVSTTVFRAFSIPVCV